MRTIFDKTTRDELIDRISSLTENSTAQWGKMNVYQMLKHCAVAEEMYLGKTHFKRMLLGRILGKFALNQLLKDEKPMGRNAPTGAGFIIKEDTGNVAAAKERWIALIEEYAHYTNPGFVHWFFGKMSKDQVGYFVYKHTDHHLRQFNS